MTHRKYYWLSVSQVLVAIIAFFAFFAWAPWFAAMSREDAIAAYHMPIPENWHTVVMEHGQLSEFRWGTISTNPWGFALCTLLLFGSWLYLLLSAWWVTRKRKQA